MTYLCECSRMMNFHRKSNGWKNLRINFCFLILLNWQNQCTLVFIELAFYLCFLLWITCMAPNTAQSNIILGTNNEPKKKKLQNKNLRKSCTIKQWWYFLESLHNLSLSQNTITAQRSIRIYEIALINLFFFWTINLTILFRYHIFNGVSLPKPEPAGLTRVPHAERVMRYGEPLSQPGQVLRQEPRVGVTNSLIQWAAATTVHGIISRGICVILNGARLLGL